MATLQRAVTKLKAAGTLPCHTRGTILQVSEQRRRTVTETELKDSTGLLWPVALRERWV
jgi:hypothetical protein